LIISKNGNIIKTENNEGTMERLELLLHPIRMRIVLTVANRVLTTQQLAELLPDVAQTTLYRHINLLLDGGVLMVVRESKIRGTIERALKVVEGAGRLDMETSSKLTPEQHEQLFTTFIASLLADFKRAQSQPYDDTPPAIYTRQHLFLTPDELQRINQQMDSLLSPYKDPTRQTEGTQSWAFTGIVMPDTAISPTDEETET
jgi:DNA-binding transcriptional ArsR family regulator